MVITVAKPVVATYSFPGLKCFKIDGATAVPFGSCTVDQAAACTKVAKLTCDVGKLIGKVAKDKNKGFFTPKLSEQMSPNSITLLEYVMPVNF